MKTFHFLHRIKIKRYQILQPGFKLGCIYSFRKDGSSKYLAVLAIKETLYCVRLIQSANSASQNDINAPKDTSQLEEKTLQTIKRPVMHEE